MPSQRLASLAALSALLTAAPDPAEACSPPFEGWTVQAVEPSELGSMSPDGPIILNGQIEVPFEIEPLLDTVHIELLDADGEAVSGHTQWSPAGADLLWWPDAPLALDQTYHLTIRVDEGDFRLNIWPFEDHQIRVEAQPTQPPAAIYSVRPAVFNERINGACIGGTDSCGDCARFESLGVERIWRVELSLELPEGPYANARMARMAVGGTPHEAQAIQARTALQALAGGGVQQLGTHVGAVDDWPGATACAAVQVFDPVEGLILDEVSCFDAPLAAVGAGDPENPPSYAVDEGGCDASAAGGAGGAWMLALLLGLAGRRRRLLGLLVVGVATLTGCQGGDPPEDGGLGAPDCLGCVQGIALPPLEQAGPTPPPIMGGTLAIEGDLAYVADPDRDRVVVADLKAGRVLAEHAAERPFRVLVDGERVFVTLRGEGALLILDVESGAELGRPLVCAAPRGLAAAWDGIHVACAGGALVSLTRDGDITRRLPLAPDLRDVVVAGGQLHVSRFRRPELISVDRAGAVVARRAPAAHDVLTHAEPSAPTVAWRTIALPSGLVVMLHQRSRTDAIPTRRPGGYGGGGFGPCGSGIVVTELTGFPRLQSDNPQPRPLGQLGGATVAVDLALVDGRLAVAAPGNHEVFGWHSGTIDLDLGAEESWGGCLRVRGGLGGGAAAPVHTAIAEYGGLPIGLQLDAPVLSDIDGRVRVELGGAAVVDTGRDLFHADAGQGIACASCHPEGSEDGHAWLFEGHGLRRTQELRGGLAGTAPFHWTGDLRDMQHLMDEVMTRRMGGPDMPPAYTDAMLAWLDAQPVEAVDPIEPGDPVAGALLFEDAVVGCAACHTGPRLADDQRYDVGTGGSFVTPTLLGIGRRGALMHDGCGATLADRFDPACGGGDAHGRTSQLSADEVQDLIAYLATL